MSDPLWGAGYALLLFLAMLGAAEAGFRLARARQASHPVSGGSGTAVIDAAIFALLGLLLAFTFSGAAGRYDRRRELIAMETNAIGTAWLRLDLLPPALQPELRDLFRQYLDSRLATYALLPDEKAALGELVRSRGVQGRIWARAVSAGVFSGQEILVLPPLNEMFDIVETRTALSRHHQPAVVLLMLLVLGVACAGLAGAATAEGGRRRVGHQIAFAAAVALTTWVMIDLEFPRTGLIRLGDDSLIELRASLEAQQRATSR